MTDLDWPAESTAYLVHAAGVIRVPMTSKLSISEKREANLSTKTTVTGRVYAQKTQRARRSWDVSLEELPSALYAPLGAAFLDSFGLGPFKWVTPHMAATNLVTPDESAVPPHTDDYSDGPTFANDGSVIPNVRRAELDEEEDFQPMNLATGVPLPPDDRDAQAAAYVWSFPGKPAVLRAYYYNRDGDLLGNTSAQLVSEDGGRLVLPLVDRPAGAVTVDLTVEETWRAGGAQVTWTSEDVGVYFPGRGCAQAVVTDFESSDGLIDHDGSWMECSFTVLEVG